MPISFTGITKNLSISPSPLWRAQLPFAVYNKLSALGGKPLSSALSSALSGSTSSFHIMDDYIFGPLNSPPKNQSRWSDSSHPVWYGAADIRTAVHESLHHAARIFVERFGVGLLDDWEEQRTLVSADCHALLVDVTGLSARHPWLIADDHEQCQKLGRYLFDKYQPGVLYDSARDRGAKCAAIFRQNALSNPAISQDVAFSCSAGTLTALDTAGDCIVSYPHGF